MQNYRQRKGYYFPESLEKQLELIPDFPLTVIEAPSGFGKTTAVREYFRKNLPEDSKEYWYTCLDEQGAAAWAGICDLFSNADPEVALKLKKLGMPTIDTLIYYPEILREFRCSQGKYLVIDNFQILNSDVLRELLSIFSLHGCPLVHMIFITQPLGARPPVAFQSPHMLTIETGAFFFDRESTSALFEMEGISLTEDELNRVHESAGGWVSAIRLQIMSYRETGSFDHTADVATLVETAIWNRLSNDERQFLISVSIKTGFTAKQAACMMGRCALPQNIKDLLRTSDFIRYFPRENIYTIHGILRDYLRSKLCAESAAFRESILRRAAKCYASEMQLYEAALLYMKARDHEAVLALPFEGIYLVDQRDKNMVGLILEFISECPESLMIKYPLKLIIFAYLMFFEGKFEAFERLAALAATVIEKNPSGLDKSELKTLRGEHALLMSLMEYNDIKKMNGGARRAYDILGSRSLIDLRDIPWTFGGVSILCMYWRESGRLEEMLRDFSKTMPYHLRVTGGQGAGADCVVKAEAMLMRGEDEKAEILCHKALYEARSRQQTSICLCAELTLARVAILRGDTEGYITAVENMRGYARDNSHLYVHQMVDLCLSVANFALGMPEKTAKWLYDVETPKKTSYSPIIPCVQIIYCDYLIRSSKYGEFSEVAELMLDTAKRMNYMLPQVYYHIFHAVRLFNGNQNDKEAMQNLDKALALALPDRIYLPFSLHWDVLEKHIRSAANLPGAAGRLPVLERITKLCERQSAGVLSVKAAIRRLESPDFSAS